MSGRSVHRRVLLPATPDRVFEFLTEMPHISRWLCQRGFFRAELGGPYRLEWDGGLHADGQITAWNPPESFQATYRVPMFMETLSNPTQVNLRVEPAEREDHTLLTLDHVGFLEDSAWDAYFKGHEQSWDVDLQQLTLVLERGSFGPILRIEGGLNPGITLERLKQSLGGEQILDTTFRLPKFPRREWRLEADKRLVVIEAYLEQEGFLEVEACYEQLRAWIAGLVSDTLEGSPSEE